MCDTPCVLVTLRIKPGSPESTAVLPKPIHTYEDGSFDVELDPVSWSMMMSCLEEWVMLDYAVEQMEEELRKQTTEREAINE